MEKYLSLFMLIRLTAGQSRGSALTAERTFWNISFKYQDKISRYIGWVRYPVFQLPSLPVPICCSAIVLLSSMLQGWLLCCSPAAALKRNNFCKFANFVIYEPSQFLFYSRQKMGKG